MHAKFLLFEISQWYVIRYINDYELQTSVVWLDSIETLDELIM